MGVIAHPSAKERSKNMKWTEFIICLILDVLLLIYLAAYLGDYAPGVPGLAKVIFAAMCILAGMGSRITYNEAKNEK